MRAAALLVLNACLAPAFGHATPAGSNAGAMITRRSPEVITREVEAMLERYGTDLTAREYHNDTLSPAEDLGPRYSFIGAAAFTYSHAISWYSLVENCKNAAKGTAPVKACLISISTTGISFLASAYHAYHSLRHIVAWFHGDTIQLGRRPGRRSLDDGDNVIVTHEEYMEWMLRNVGLEGSYVGHHQRSASGPHTPVYKFTGLDDNDYFYTISPRPNGEVRHTIGFYSDQHVFKRQGYEGYTVKGGMDLDACQRNGGDYGSLPLSAKEAYKHYYPDMQCLFPSDNIEYTTYIQGNVYGTNSRAQLTVGMTAYTGNSADNVDQRAACSNYDFPHPSKCIN